MSWYDFWWNAHQAGQIDDLDEKVKTLEEKVETLKEWVDYLNKKIEGLENDGRIRNNDSR
jgi:peptidoglycan hydrolase CwlO-like protein